MVIRMSDLWKIDPKLHVVVRPSKGKDLCQRVSDNAGIVMGRVADNLCKIFRELVDSKLAQNISLKHY